MLGGAYVSRAKSDGYTILMDASNHAQNPALREKMTFDTLKDFAPVSLLIKVPNVLVVNPSSKINSVADVTAEYKDRKSVVKGQSVALRVSLGGRRIIKKI